MIRLVRHIVERLLPVIVFMVIGVSALAQTSISGVVKDGKGEPVPGAVVMLSTSRNTATITDASGKYRLALPADAKGKDIVVSCIGYKDYSLQLNGAAVFDIVLQEDAEELDEVVVVGYGSMHKSDLTGSVTSVKINEEVASRTSSIDQLLQGRAAGVQVLSNGGAPDSGVSIRIRGLSSFNGSTEPLYVVDGIIINGGSTTESLITQGSDNSGTDEATNGLMGLNPQDIANIEVLKDASATAIYGALGANGVVLITTKSANRERPLVRINAGVDITSPYRKMDILNSEEYGLYLRDKLRAGTGLNTLAGLRTIYEDVENLTGLRQTPVDWQDECMRTTLSQRYFFSISGKPKTVAYAFSLGYSDKQGIILNTGVKQYTIRLNLDKTLGKAFKFGTKTNVAYVDSDLTQATGNGSMTAATSMVRAMLSYRPFAPNGYYEDIDDDSLLAAPVRWVNPEHFINSRKEYRITPSIYAEYKFLPSLTFRSTLGGDYRNSERQKYKSIFINTTTEGSIGASGTYEYFTWNWDNLLMFNKKTRIGNISGTVGTSAHSNITTSQVIQGWHIDQYKAGIESLNSAPDTLLGYSDSSSQTMSFFVRGIYNYKDRYVLTSTYRIDGSSKFKGSNKWATFPSFAFAWRVNQEPWFKVPVVSSAKVRLGWGRVGNQAIANYQTMSNFENGRVPAHDPGNTAETTVALYPANMANHNLKWETTEQINAGLDLSLWKGRLSLTADTYLKTTFDLLQNKLVATSSGFSTVAINEGTIQNKGLELSMDLVPLKYRIFELALNANISFNRNKIVFISKDADTKDIWITTDRQEKVVYFLGQQIGSSSYCTQPANIFMEGYPMGLFYGYKIKRIIPQGETGLPLVEGGDPGTEGQFDYYDLNGNGLIDEEDQTIIGNPNPKFTYGFGLNVQAGRFTLNANFTGSYGNDIFNINYAPETDTYTSTRNILRPAYYEAWTPENPDTKFPALGKIRQDDYKKLSDFYIEDGSYLRLASISLTYNIPIKKGSRIFKGASVGVSGGNLYVWTRYQGWDPDVNSYGTNIRKMGVDSGSYPSSKTYSMDIKLTF